MKFVEGPESKAIAYARARPVILANPIEEAYETARHEIAHALLDPSEKHGERWKAKAIEVGAKPIACGWYNLPPFKYVVYCPLCDEGIKGYHVKPRRDFSVTWCNLCGPDSKGLLILKEQ